MEYPKIPCERYWPKGSELECVTVHGSKWRISALRQRLESEPEYDLPLAFIPLGEHKFETPDGLLDYARHYVHVMDCSPDSFIVLDGVGSIIDGRHTIIRALIDGRTAVKARRVPDGWVPSVLA